MIGQKISHYRVTAKLGATGWEEFTSLGIRRPSSNFKKNVHGRVVANRHDDFSLPNPEEAWCRRNGTYLGEKEKAFALLEKADQARIWSSELKYKPCFESLRTDPRFDELVRRINLQ
jgi:hypothetical protein